MTAPYFRDSRAPRYSILFAVPLLVAYELSAFLLADSTGVGIRNGADVILKAAFVTLGGHRGLLVFEALLLVTGLWLVARDWKAHPGPLRATTFLTMLAESAALAVVVGVVVGRLTAMLLPSLMIMQGAAARLDTGTQLMVSLGAGIYEELLFRVIVVGAIAFITRKLLGWAPRTSGVVAAILGALVFSAFHYVGTFGDPLRADTFLFRFLAGIVFSAMYLTRGFGITAWTHALYDVFVTLG